MHSPHVGALTTRRCTHHTWVHSPHVGALTTRGCTHHTWVHSPHVGALTTRGCTHHTWVHSPHVGALTTRGCTHHTWVHSPCKVCIEYVSKLNVDSTLIWYAGVSCHCGQVYMYVLCAWHLPAVAKLGFPECNVTMSTPFIPSCHFYEVSQGNSPVMCIRCSYCSSV